MKKLAFLGILSAVAMLMASCGDDGIAKGTKGHGRLSLALDVNTSVKSSGKASRAEVSDLTADDLSIALKSADGSFNKTYASVSEFVDNATTNTVTLPVGNYTLEAYYGDGQTEDFEAPHLYGSAQVKVREGETTHVGVTAALANSMFSVSYTDALKKYLSDYSAEVQTPGGKAINFGASELRPAYVKPGTVAVYVNATKPNGKSVHLLAANVTAQACHHYRIEVDMNGGEVGEGQMVVTFDDALDTEDYVVDLSDELMNQPAPEVDINGQPTAEVTIISGAGYANPLTFNIIARGQIDKVLLTTTNASVVDPAWPDGEVNLSALSPAEQEKLKAIGLKALGVWKNPDVMAVVDVQHALDDVFLAPGQDAAKVVFSLNVVDKNGKTAPAPAVLTVNVEKESVQLSNPGAFVTGSTQLAVDLAYNGGHPDKRINMQYKNSRGTWSNATATYAPISGQDNAYRVTVDGLPADGDVTLRACTVESGIASNEIIVTHEMPTTYSVSASAANVWADKADIDVYLDDFSLTKYSTVYVESPASRSGIDATLLDNGLIRLSGLTPGTQYTVKVSLTGSEDEAYGSCTFTTEAAMQLPNAGMEDWCTPKTFDNSKLYVPAANEADAAWETLNRQTTSQEDPRAYCCTSGTIPTNDASEGSTAALIRTVGWGSGNTAAGGVSRIKHITQGELYLGTWPGLDQTPDYGYAFTSRPKSMTCKAKYAPKNSADRGYAEVTLKDADGNVIATCVKAVEPASEYGELTLPLTYTSNAKAAQIVVIFRSTNAGDKYLTSGDLDRGSISRSAEHVGSKLYIDDITLNY